MTRILPLLPLLVIPLVSAYFVFAQGIVKIPWLETYYKMDTLPESDSFTLESDHTGGGYRIFVQVPHGYPESEERYPVFYAIDGPPATPIYEEMVLPLLQRGRIPETIFVGIVLPSPPPADENPFAGLARGMNSVFGPQATHRSRHLSFDVDPRYGQKGSGAGDAFLAFIQDELIPEIDRRYRTKPDDRGIGGYDMGGLFAVSACVRDPGLFQRVLAIAPRAQWANYALIGRLRQEGVTASAPVRMYIGVGERDSDEFLNGWQTLAGALGMADWPGLVLQAELLSSRGHSDVVVPAAQSGLSFIYGDAR